MFTLLTIFAYISVFAARVSEDAGILNSWINVPSNLLILMVISIGTVVGSRAIKVEQAKSGALPLIDNSSLTTNRDGKTDLVKIQMLIWTVIAIIVYLTILHQFISNHCFLFVVPEGCPKNPLTLPDIDTAFMVLLGVSQGGYVANQLADKPTT
jgi:hypothetical protein